MERLVRVLLIEDNETDAELVRLELERAGLSLEWDRVDNERELRRRLAEGTWDLAISDFAMPTFDGLHAFQIVHGICPEVPFIFVSGVLGEERAVEAMRSGAKDYILKDNLVRLGVAARRELSAARTRQSEKSLEVYAREEQRRLTMAVEASGAGIFEYLPQQGSLLYVNARLRSILGIEESAVYTRSVSVERLLELAHPADRVGLAKEVSAFLGGQSALLSVEVRLPKTDGSWVEVAVFAKALSRDDEALAHHVIGVMMDITERRGLEAQLRQAQKMEAVGRLAGGVAHDFNNLLTAIFSFAEFAQRKLDPASSPHKDIAEVIKAAERAQALTSQLLAFSRRRRIDPRIVDVNSLLVDLRRMLERVVGEDVILETKLAERVGNVCIDPGSFEQVIVNLAVNARDAMPTGGRLLIETREVSPDLAVSSESSSSSGSGYVEILVTDEGVGMDEKTLAHLFEPFFTTKGPGVGTGLGLSTCYGIINQAGGSISVESALGQGSRFRILLPVTAQEAIPEGGTHKSSSVRGTETILVVEDEAQLRKLTARALKEFGYKILTASNGDEALEIAEHRIDEIDLLLTDVIMPGIGGKALAERLAARNPKLKLLFMSGYDPDRMQNQGLGQNESGFLQKPFTPKGLGLMVRRVLDSQRSLGRVEE